MSHRYLWHAKSDHCIKIKITIDKSHNLKSKYIMDAYDVLALLSKELKFETESPIK